MRLFVALLMATVAAWALSACGEREEPEITATTTPQFEIIGSWRGQLEQQGRMPFTVEATIKSLERFKDNTVRYGGIDCSGTWEYLGATETAYRFRERIDRGQSTKCKGTGTVTLTPVSDDSVAYEFSGGGVVSTGELRRILPAKSG